MKILVTGGSGFIGTNLIDCYLKKGFNILNIDIAPPKKKEHADFWKAIDIRDAKKLTSAIIDFEPEYVIHLAARANLTGTSIDDYSANTNGVRNIMEACNKCDKVKKVIFASTMLVCAVGYYPKSDIDYSPPNLYGESKAIGEKIVRENASKLHYEWAIVRPTSIWGPWFGPTYRKFFEMILNKKYVNFSGKSATKIYGFIDNTVYQINAILFSDATTNIMYYLGDYDPVNLKDWAKEIATELGIQLFTLPKSLIFCTAIFGDFLQNLKIKFPMNTFRYKNMTTDNIIPLDRTKLIAPHLPSSRKEGNIITLRWMKDYHKS